MEPFSDIPLKRARTHNAVNREIFNRIERNFNSIETKTWCTRISRCSENALYHLYYNQDNLEWETNFYLDFSGKSVFYQKGIPSSNFSAIFFEESIYMFSCLRNFGSKRYNLRIKKWQNMPSLPEPSQNLSLAIYDQKILILGSQHSKLYLFDPTIMSYSNLNLNLKGNTPKVVYANDGMINILVYEGNSFISINRSLFSYTNLGNLSFPKDFFDIDGCVVLTEKFLEINNRKFEINSANKRVVEIFDK